MQRNRNSDKNLKSREYEEKTHLEKAAKSCSALISSSYELLR